MDLSVLYEDEDILAVDKPAGMPVHPSMGNYENTLANGSAFYFESKNLFCPFRCINRLDRDTSGALLLAKNPLSAAILSTQMKRRKIRRTYLAVVKGIHPGKRKNLRTHCKAWRFCNSTMCRFRQGESAVTFYERLDTRNGHSLLELHLETGRTHQIRVHMGYLGYPLPADYLYCPDYSRFSRQPLHSVQIEFSHPITGRQMCLTAPVPPDMVQGFL